MADSAIAIIGAALDLGAGRRGVDMGPSAIRYAGLEERLTSLGCDCADSGQRRHARRRGDRERRPAGALPRGDSQRRASRSHGAWARRWRRGGCRSCSAATTRSRSGRSAGWPPRRAGRGAVLWIDAHGDLNTPRPRRAATSTGCRSRRRSGRRDGLRERRLAAAGARPGAHDAHRRPLAGRRRARAARRARPGGAHDERDRPPRHRAARRRRARARGGRRLRPRLAGHGRARSRGRARRGDGGARRPAPTARRTWRWSSSPNLGCWARSRSSRSIRSSIARTRRRRWRWSWRRARSARGSSKSRRCCCWSSARGVWRRAALTAASREGEWRRSLRTRLALGSWVPGGSLRAGRASFEQVPLADRGVGSRTAIVAVKETPPPSASPRAVAKHAPFVHQDRTRSRTTARAAGRPSLPSLGDALRRRAAPQRDQSTPSSSRHWQIPTNPVDIQVLCSRR